ncbi:MAG: LuxR C-terminal-related transcriptional regulator [Micrococcales bacterium]|nr:LuxR C-terminal-related transcriptional regulator [Micrococcales bacterium]
MGRVMSPGAGTPRRGRHEAPSTSSDLPTAHPSLAMPLEPTPEGFEHLSDQVMERQVTIVYGLAVHTPNPSRDRIVAGAEALGLDAAAVDRAAGILHWRGLIDCGDAQAWRVPSPAATIPSYAANLEALARDARTRMQELEQSYRDARALTQGHIETEGERPLFTQHDIGVATDELMRTAATEVLCMRATTPRTEALFAAPLYAHSAKSLNTAGNPLPIRTAYDTGVLDYNGSLDVLRSRMTAGEEVRLISGVPFTVIVGDADIALVEASQFGESDAMGVLLRAKPLVAAFARLVETYWQWGSPLPRSGTPSATAGLEERDVVILRLMAAGAADATIARQTGVSVRTIERRMSVIFAFLGASSRFEAGVLAARLELV